jgi:hypothetical protein
MALWTKPALSAKRSSERHVETASASGSATSAPSNSQALVAHYGRLPLAFEPNVSHPESGVQYLAHGNGYTIFIGPNNATLALKGSSSSAALHMKLSGGNATNALIASDELPGKSNYILGNRPENWHTNVPNFGKVSQHGVYPGIDVVYYGTQRNLEYDFLVAPQANPDAIRFALDGADNLRVDSRGDLLVELAGSTVRLQKPVAYQELEGHRQLVDVKYRVKDKREVTFAIARYDAARPLVIDPVLSYSTYLGGSNIDGANAIAVAPDNTAFIAGGTFSTDFPTAHPLQPNAGGGNDFPQDAFVAKISADGSTLLYSTYLGGTNSDVANGIAVDTFGEAYVTGTTLSPDFPVTPGSFDTLCGGDGKCGASWNTQGLIVSNAFVTKLNTAGTGLVYSGYLGVYENVRGQAIAIDNNENAYVTGQVEANLTPTVPITPPATGPAPFPIVSGIQPLGYGGGATDAFVTKISSSGSSILFSTYLGGSNEDIGYGIAADNTGVAYVTGLTYSVDFPVTAGNFPEGGTPGQAGDAFVSKVNTIPPTSLLFSTYVGGTGLDQGNGIALDGTGNIYVAGTTNSVALGITSLNANKGQGDAFVLKLTPGPGPTYTLAYFTFLGGGLADAGTGIAADLNGDAYVTGSTVSTDFPVAGSVFQTTFGGGNADAFVTKLNASGALVYSSYLGGTNTDVGYGIAVDTSGSAYVAGQTCSQDFPLANPLQAGPGGNCDAFISKVSTQGGISLTPAGLSFPGQSLNTTSTPQTITLANIFDTGTTSVTVSNVVAAGDFAQTNTCTAAPIPAGANCAITVTFSPTGPGIRKGTITITDSAPGSPHVVNLTGNTSSVLLSPSNLNFGTQNVGVVSTSQAVTLTNGGATTLTVSSITASGDFAETNTCSVPLVAGTNCAILVTYKPSTVGAGIGALVISDNAPGSPQIILLKGNGGTNSPNFSPSTTSLSFGNQTVGVASGPQSVTVTNNGGATLTISSITASGDFTQTNSCSTPLPVGTNCIINVTYKPSAVGPGLGAVTIVDNAPGNPHSIQLSGIGIQPVPGIALAPTSVAFGNQLVGVASIPQAVTVTNTGTGTLNISSITASGDFSQTNSCSAPLPVGTNCIINVTYKPSAIGSGIGAVTIADNAPGNPHSIQLSGTGVVPGITLTPGNLVFPSQLVGVTSAPQTVTVTNTGTGTLSISSITASGDFSQTNSCSAPLPVGTNCIINVTYKPSGTGPTSGAVTITDNAPTSPQSISLSGTGAPAVPAVTVTPTSLSFGSQPIGVVSTPQSVTITNSGTGTLTISSISASGDFAETDACTAPLPAGTNCVMNVTYKPSGAGASVGAITITDNAAGSPHTVHLTGTGVSSGFSFSVPLASATVSAGQTLTITPVAGFSQPVAITCGNLPRDVSCTISPNPVTITGTAPSTVTISVLTGLRTLVPGSRPKIDPLGTLRRVTNPWAVPIVLAFALAIVAMTRRRPALAVFGLAAALLLVSAGCGGGGQAGVPAGTPAGTYQITVTGTAGSLTNSTTLTLQVN